MWNTPKKHCFCTFLNFVGLQCILCAYFKKCEIVFKKARFCNLLHHVQKTKEKWNFLYPSPFGGKVCMFCWKKRRETHYLSFFSFFLALLGIIAVSCREREQDEQSSFPSISGNLSKSPTKSCLLRIQQFVNIMFMFCKCF